MELRQGMQVRLIASSVVLALTLSQFAGAQAAVPSQNTSPAASQQAEDQLPDSPGAVQAGTNQPPPPRIELAQASNSQAPEPEQTPSQEPGATTVPPTANTNSLQSNDQSSDQVPEMPKQSGQSSDQVPEMPKQSGEPSTQPSAQSQQTQQQPREPVGTAAAETVQTTGVAASRPAGAALAPAKQRRVRSILIKVGALVGVGVAVGTTMALSQGSPSKPPGSN